MPKRRVRGRASTKRATGDMEAAKTTRKQTRPFMKAISERRASLRKHKHVDYHDPTDGIDDEPDEEPANDGLGGVTQAGDDAVDAEAMPGEAETTGHSAESAKATDEDASDVADAGDTMIGEEDGADDAVDVTLGEEDGADGASDVMPGEEESVGDVNKPCSTVGTSSDTLACANNIKQISASTISACRKVKVPRMSNRSPSTAETSTVVPLCQLQKHTRQSKTWENVEKVKKAHTPVMN
ncbi:hypothetical protein PHYPSEUDO_002832 [Phytophthora pseudosyringae]|uniref:Uncharacterized protein n=1 Tax=Phytophthora pseudosyringae TaxID=221518 RepID=A0A8T1VW32_9STRA|nr:hypothetical protein PHYPSEUDO_002832 [Phytophthora pseudosyringae]